jgi:hypothetical protein
MKAKSRLFQGSMKSSMFALFLTPIRLDKPCNLLNANEPPLL